MTGYDALFTPGSIGGLELPNRLIMAPMATNYADDEHRVTEQLIAYHVARARGGVGLQIVEHTAVHPLGLASARMLAVYDDATIPGLQALTDAVHEADGRIALQLQHAGGQANADVIGRRPLAPSAVSAPGRPQPEKMTEAQIMEAVEAFGEGAHRAREAGFDGVEVHLAHGFLGCAFLSPYFNRRDDDWGGDTERRTRFAREVRRAIAERCGADFPCWCRIVAEEPVEGGTDLDEARRFAPMLEEAGYQAIHVSSSRQAIASYYAPHGHLLDLAAGVRGVVGVPVIGVGRIVEPDLAERALDEGRCDFIALGRALLADPDWPRKVREERADEITPCIGCNLGCMDRSYGGGQTQCTVNLWTGREAEWPGYPNEPRASRKKRVLVVGAGPGGMQAAIVAARRGHEVTLWEATGEVGGAFRLAALPPGKSELAGFTRWQLGELNRAGVALELNTHATADMVLDFDPDVTIVATGGVPLGAGGLPYGAGGHFAMADDVLEGDAALTSPIFVVSVEGYGAEVAHLLAEQGCAVTILESGDDPAPHLPAAPKAFLLKRLEELHVTIRTGHKVLGLDAEGIMIETAAGPTRVDDPGTVVLALGRRPDDKLAADLEGSPVATVVIGDARRPWHAQAAIHEGAQAAREI